MNVRFTAVKAMDFSGGKSLMIDKGTSTALSQRRIAKAVSEAKVALLQ